MRPGVERREIILTGVDLRAFDPSLVVVEGNVVIRLGSFEDTSNLRFRNVKERGGSLLLRDFADLVDEILYADSTWTSLRQVPVQIDC